MRCDNTATLPGTIISPRCWNGKATRVCTVTYCEGDSDTFHLCEKCAAALRKDVRRHGYRFSSTKLKGGEQPC